MEIMEDARDAGEPRLLAGLALLAPVVFVIHVIEEGPRFVPWFNSLVEPDISEPLFLTVNGVAFLITVALASALAATREPAIAVVDLAWLGFLMFANGLFHLTATVVHHRYSPGSITAACLYLPYFALLFTVVLRRLRVSWGVALLATVLGALPMAAHGYLIVFRGSRLF
ncbi:MAG TPA: HXXEE domain-containing protein [Thermoanaerobaculia bacterium]|nr:HXXEE domain-containing protein [Thermoanaerobaculia bacterium]